MKPWVNSGRRAAATLPSSVLVGLVVLAVVAGCGGGRGGEITIPAVLSSGIRGVAVQVIEGGPQPVPPAPTPTPIIRPLPGAIITVQAASGGREVARVRADADGRFAVTLPPGDYLIVPLPPPNLPVTRGEPRMVSVQRGQFADVTIRYITAVP